MENAGAIGLPLPEKLKDTLAQLKEKSQQSCLIKQNSPVIMVTGLLLLKKRLGCYKASAASNAADHGENIMHSRMNPYMGL